MHYVIGACTNKYYNMYTRHYSYDENIMQPCNVDMYIPNNVYWRMKYI